MATRTATTVARADVVGSLLRPEYLREIRDAARAGTVDPDELHAAEDRAVREAIALQEGAGIDAITDGEYRRNGWIALIPIFDDPIFRPPVSGFEFLDAESGWRDLWKTGAGEKADTSGLPPQEPFVTRRLEVDRDIVTDEYAFLKAKGVAIGNMQIADEEVAAATNLLPHVGTKITLPDDSLCAKSDDLNATQVFEGEIPAGFEGVDIGPKTLALYADKIKQAGTVIWNGPVGWFEKPAFSNGTKGIAAAMAASPAVTVVGGGETAEAVEQFGFDDKMTHVSTGGGAFLAYVEGKKFKSLGECDERG